MSLEDTIHSLTDPDPYKRMKAAWELGEFGGDRAVELLLDTVDDDDIFVKNIALGALIKIGEPAIPFVIEALKDEKKDWTGLRKVLGESGEPAVKPLIEAIRNEDDVMTQGMIAHAFGDIGEPALLPLLDLMDEGDENLRKIALIGLSDIGRSAIPHLIQLLDKENDENMRLLIIKALLTTNHPAAIEHLFKRGLLK